MIDCRAGCWRFLSASLIEFKVNTNICYLLLFPFILMQIILIVPFIPWLCLAIKIICTLQYSDINIRIIKNVVPQVLIMCSLLFLLSYNVWEYCLFIWSPRGSYWNSLWNAYVYTQYTESGDMPFFTEWQFTIYDSRPKPESYHSVKKWFRSLYLVLVMKC